jgi:microcystin-dependent protein
MASQPYLGAIFMFAGNFAPSGYQLCQGQLLSISQNAALFSILGTYYGGNGTTTFALPDLQCRVPVGTGNGVGLTPVVLGEKAGVGSVTILTANMPAHTHALNCDNNANDTTNLSPATSFVSAQATTGQGGTGVTNFSPGPSNATMAPTSIGIAGQGLPLNIQNPFLGVSYIIAMVGIFPSRN